MTQSEKEVLLGPVKLTVQINLDYHYVDYADYAYH